jgi:hypothetical protein
MCLAFSPPWVLITHIRDLVHVSSESGCTPPKSGAAVESVGKLVSYLVHCLFNEGQLTEHETEAMNVLLEAR